MTDKGAELTDRIMEPLRGKLLGRDRNRAYQATYAILSAEFPPPAADVPLSEYCDRCIQYGNDIDNPVKHQPEDCPRRKRPAAPGGRQESRR